MHLVAAIALRRELLRLAASDDERGAAQNISATALLASASGKAGRRGSRKQSRPIARR